jgi:type IV pilus assembly protein PilM
LETVAWDYQILEPTAAGKDDDGVAIKPVALCGAKLEDVQAHLAPFNERAINVDMLQSDAAALYNFAAWEQQLPNDNGGSGKQVVVVLEVGASSSNVVVSDGRTFSMRGIPLGGNDFARALAREFRLTREQSEKLKRAPTAAPYLHQVYTALTPVFQTLATEAWQPVDQYLLQDPRRTKHRLLLLGGETKLHGLLKYLCHGE